MFEEVALRSGRKFDHQSENLSSSACIAVILPLTFGAGDLIEEITEDLQRMISGQ